jgi:hypothetical protein
VNSSIPGIEDVGSDARVGFGKRCFGTLQQLGVPHQSWCGIMWGMGTARKQSAAECAQFWLPLTVTELAKGNFTPRVNGIGASAA